MTMTGDDDCMYIVNGWKGGNISGLILGFVQARDS